ncbi:hypothetical protein [Myxococcus sp. RHSTA-1-4]|uniref:hypothetical protein n=1 Tax=Myxococcus sp. RHSTA-1-4 TaxID=2874601 RepID=UPI001CBFD5A2|nr:hypothetical protein [Myxococcus sp. RHSTA-1-4]MBZ4418051.1 hypothetical protein [Myxococcus sp. RHSTA-1-4]
MEPYTNAPGSSPSLEGAWPAVTYLSYGSGCTGGPTLYEPRVKYRIDAEQLKPVEHERTIVDNYKN